MSATVARFFIALTFLFLLLCILAGAGDGG